MPDFLPVSLQDLMHGRQPKLRTEKISPKSKQRISFAAYYTLLNNMKNVHIRKASD